VHRHTTLLPDGIQVGGKDFAVAADDGNIEIESGGCNHSVGHVWNFCAWDLAQRLNNGYCENRFSEDVVGIRNCAKQFIVSRLGKAILLDQIHQLNQGDGGDGYFLSCKGGPVDEGSGVKREAGVAENVPDGRVRIGNPGNPQNSSPKSWNISARFWSISSADGPGPRLEQTP